jgi:hypothetical protein
MIIHHESMNTLLIIHKVMATQSKLIIFLTDFNQTY